MQDEQILKSNTQVPGIAGYKWVPARLARFYQNKILFFTLPMAN